MSCKPYTSRDKWVIAVMAGLLFLVLASPYTYVLTGSVGQTVGANLSNYEASNKPNGCPTLLGLTVHAIVFLLIARLLLSIGDGNCNGANTSKDKWMAAIIAAILFFIIASPFLFGVTNSVLGLVGIHTTNDNGCPNLGGLILHTAVFIILVRILLR